MLLPSDAKSYHVIDALIYSRESILALEGWRLVSGHFVHVNMQHALINWSLYAICFYLLKPYLSVIKFFTMTLLIALLTGLMLLIFAPDIKIYLGLSGVLHGLFMFAGLTLLKEKSKLGFFIIIFLILKMVTDLFNHGALLPNSDFMIASQAHVLGAIAGGMVYGILSYKNKCGVGSHES